MTDSRVKIDLMIYQMVDFQEEFVLMQGEPPVDVSLKGGTMSMQIRQKTSEQKLLAIFDSTLSTDPAYEAGKPLKGRIILPAPDATDNLGKYTLTMEETHTAHLCPDGKPLDGEYDIVYTDGAGSSKIIQYGAVKMIPSPTRPDTVTP